MNFNVDVNIRAVGAKQINDIEQQIKSLQNKTVDVRFNATGMEDITKMFSSSGISNKARQAGQQAGKSYASALSSSIKNIQRDINNFKFDATLSRMNAQLNKYNSQSGNVALDRARTAQVNFQKSYTQLQGLLKSGVQVNDERVVSAFDNMTNASEQFKNAMSSVNAEMSKTLADGIGRRSADQVQKYMDTNTKALSKYRTQLEAIRDEYKMITTQSQKVDLDNRYKNLQATISAEGLSGKSRWSEIKRATGQIAEFAGVYGMIQNVAFEVPRQIVSSVMDVDAALTTLQMATGVSNTQAQELMSTYSEMGSTLKATATDVAASATEWLKQGKTIAESQKLAEDSIILSKIGDLSSEDATKTITAAMKSYNLDEAEVMNFVDQISAIDMASATDVGGLATAFNEVAANARQAGVETQELLSYAAVIGETTQEGMASVGTSLNAIFARMGNIKLARLKDYENNGEDLSNVETVLRGVGISLRSSTNEFRDFDEVLAETASRWNSFSGVQKRAVSQAFAGTHHMNEFMILMQNFPKAQEYMQIATDSSGESMRKYEAYTESAAGKIENFKNSFQTLSTTVLNSDIFKGVIDSGSQFLDILTKITSIGGGLPALLGIVGGTSLFKNLD